MCLARPVSCARTDPIPLCCTTHPAVAGSVCAAVQAAVPLVYIPLEAVVSKWYGESEKMLAGGWAWPNTCSSSNTCGAAC
jgi:hypothetical protein